ncbi:MAG TPA: peptidylprolyl isomerase [Phycisphaerae bacterium]|nr:peptidylprolyl isomerase [Phycisphaerae bacterium]
MNMFQQKKTVAKPSTSQPAAVSGTATNPATTTTPAKAVTSPDDAMPVPAAVAATSGASEVEFTVENARPIMANVNGKPIYMEKLTESLVSDYGLPIARQFVADEVVRQVLASRNISDKVTDQEINRESMRAMRMLFPMEDNITDEQFENILGQFLRNYRYTRRQWNQTMARNVLLSRLIEKNIPVTDAELKDAFFRKYDGKYTARLIQVSSLDKAQGIIETLNDDKADFATLAKKESISPTAGNGGLFEIGAKTSPDWVPPAIVKVVRSMKVGEVSEPVMAGATFHIIKLEAMTPPQDVKFDDVKNELAALVREAKLQQERQKYLAELIKTADIDFVDPTLRTQNEKRLQKTDEAAE